MSHVDEGTLHAYLDGALDSLPAAEAERARRHLATCDACQARLEEERAVRDEAAAILGGVSLDLGELPSFEEVRALAHANPAVHGPAARIERLAWAATVIVALGTGWMLRGGMPQPEDGFDGAESAPAPAAPPVGAPRPEAAGPGLSGSEAVASNAEVTEPERTEVMGRVRTAATGREREEATGRDGAPTATEADAAAAKGSLPEGGAGANRAATPKALADSDAVLADATRVEPLEPAELWAAARQRREMSPARFVSPPPAAALEPSAGAGSVARLTREARRVVGPAASVLPTRGEAPESMGNSLVVPGLAVVSVTWLDAPDLAGAVRVLQLMENGDTLELVHLPAGVNPDRLPAVDDDRTQVRSPREGGWLVARARASAEVLSALLGRLERGR